MESVLAELELLLVAFVERDLPGALFVACDPAATLYLAQILARRDEQSESDLYLTFTETAPTAAVLVDAISENLVLQRAALAAFANDQTSRSR